MVVVEAAEVLVEAAPEDVGMSSARLGNLSHLVRRYVDEGKLAGAISLVARRGRVVHCDVYGEMDAERHTPMRTDTIFRIYSMTKPIASLGLMMLHEEGRFQLDDPVDKFIPELGGLKVFDGGTAEAYSVREPARQMTVHDLLTHMSGLDSRQSLSVVGELYRRAGIGGLDTQGTLGQMVRTLGQLPLAADPGQRWIYGISTDVVGYLCEVLSGLPFDQYLQERIFGPLGMLDTAFSVPASDVHRFAANYGPCDGTPAFTLIDAPATSAFARPRTYFSGVGGLVSTLSDYLRLCRMLLNGGELDGLRLVGPRTLQLMTSNHLPGGKDLATMAPDMTGIRLNGIGFGIGFAVLLDAAAAARVGTPGEYSWGGAASTHFFICPAEELIVIFLAQLLPMTTYLIDRRLHATVYSAIVN